MWWFLKRRLGGFAFDCSQYGNTEKLSNLQGLYCWTYGTGPSVIRHKAPFRTFSPKNWYRAEWRRVDSMVSNYKPLGSLSCGREHCKALQWREWKLMLIWNGHKRVRYTNKTLSTTPPHSENVFYHWYYIETNLSWWRNSGPAKYAYSIQWLEYR